MKAIEILRLYNEYEVGINKDTYCKPVGVRKPYYIEAIAELEALQTNRGEGVRAMEMCLICKERMAKANGEGGWATIYACKCGNKVIISHQDRMSECLHDPIIEMFYKDKRYGYIEVPYKRI